jgi:hypothetical protein
MEVVCTKAPRAYIDAPELPVDARGDLNLTADVELIPRPVDGGDGTPTLVPAGCDYAFDFDLDPRLWDVNTKTLEDGTVVIVERHAAVRCPRCGQLADHLVEPVAGDEPLIFTDRAERLRAVALDAILRTDPDIAGWPAARLETLIRGVMGAADAGYAHVTEGAVALSAATPKTIIGAKAHANSGLQLAHVEVGFDGVTATAVPVLIELVYSTWATNAPGTNSTSTTARQEYGRALTAGWTGAKNWTTEPTALTVLEERLISPYGGGLVIYDYPLGTLPDSALAEGFGVRCTAPATVNVRATMKVKRG